MNRNDLSTKFYCILNPSIHRKWQSSQTLHFYKDLMWCCGGGGGGGVCARARACVKTTALKPTLKLTSISPQVAAGLQKENSVGDLPPDLQNSNWLPLLQQERQGGQDQVFGIWVTLNYRGETNVFLLHFAGHQIHQKCAFPSVFQCWKTVCSRNRGPCVTSSSKTLVPNPGNKKSGNLGKWHMRNIPNRLKYEIGHQRANSP